jgi:hypothetical protein
MRSSQGRRFRALVDDLSRDLGGLDHLSAADRFLVRHATCLIIQLEAMQGRLLQGATGIAADEVIRLSSEARRSLQSIRRRDQDVKNGGIDLRTYAASLTDRFV